MEPFENFEFKPLTEGLGFQKKAEKLKHDIKKANIGERKVGRSVPDMPPSGLLKSSEKTSEKSGERNRSRSRKSGLGSSADFNTDGIDLTDETVDLDSPRPASKSISDLIAALPPSLDFLGGDSEKASDDETEPGMNYPLLKKRKRQGEGKGTTSQGTPSQSLYEPSSYSNSSGVSSFGSSVNSSLGSSSNSPTNSSFNAVSSAIHSSSAALGRSGFGSESETSRPQIHQPLGRSDYTHPSEKSSLKAPAPGTRATVAAPLSTSPSPALRAPTPTFKTTPGKPVSSSATGSAVSNSSSVPASPSGAAASASIGGGMVAPSPFSSPRPNEPGGTLPTIGEREKIRSKALQAPSVDQVAAPASQLVKVSAGFSAAILDGMAILGVSTIFLVIILMITQIDIVRLLTYAKTSVATHVQLALLFLSVMQIYMLSARSFFGATLGEWAFDMFLGTEEDRRMANYPIKAMWRMILILLTGIVVLPILSKIFRRDVLADLGGLQLYRRP